MALSSQGYSSRKDCFRDGLGPEKKWCWEKMLPWWRSLVHLLLSADLLLQSAFLHSKWEVRKEASSPLWGSDSRFCWFEWNRNPRLVNLWEPPYTGWHVSDRGCTWAWHEVAKKNMCSDWLPFLGQSGPYLGRRDAGNFLFLRRIHPFETGRVIWVSLPQNQNHMCVPLSLV